MDGGMGSGLKALLGRCPWPKSRRHPRNSGLKRETSGDGVSKFTEFTEVYRIRAKVTEVPELSKISLFSSGTEVGCF